MLDYFKKDASSLRNKKLFLFDMDGTIYNENRLFDGTIELLDFIKHNNNKYVFITNNSSKSSNAYIEKLEKMNVYIKKDEIFSSIDASIIFLNNNYLNKKVFVQGTKSFKQQLLEADIDITEDIEDDIDLIITGYDTELNYEKLKKICYLLSTRDLPYYATNPDLVCPCEFGYLPDNGSVAKMIENATNKRPIYIGKPEPTMINLLVDKFNVLKKETVVIGDRLYTDIASGINANVETICVLSGEANLDDLSTTSFKPTYVFEDVKNIYETLKSKN